MSSVSQNKRIWGWMAFDWASQPFYTLGLTFIFGPFFASTAANFFQFSQGLDGEAAAASAQSIWFWSQAIAGILIALSAPIIGAYADNMGRRMPWIAAFGGVFVIASWALWYCYPDGSTLIFVLIAFNVALIGAEFMLIFVNALLPSLGDKTKIGYISGNGAALGYWGGFVSLLIMLLLLADNDTGRTILGNAPLFGLDGEMREGTRAVGPFIALWFLIFMIPFGLWVREPRVSMQSGGVSKALRELKFRLLSLPKQRSLFNYLLSSMFYRDALNGVYAAGGFYGALVLGFDIMQFGLFGIIGVIGAAIITQIAGLFDEVHGPKPIITVSCVTLILVCCVIIGMDREGFFGLISFSGGAVYGIAIYELIFYGCGFLIGGAGGAIYAASRSMMVRHAHPDRPTEAFGLFALSGKATAFLAPFLIFLLTFLFQDVQIGYLSLIFLFVLGLYFLRYVDPEGDQT